MRNYAEDYADVNFKFPSKNLSGVPTAIVSGAFAVYKSNNTTQSTAGLTFTGSFDGITGLNNINIDLNSDAFYVTGADYQIVATAGTVDSVSIVGEVVGEFGIENQYMRGIDLTTTANNNLESQFDGTGLSGDTFPSTQSQLSGLAVGSGGISTIADSFTLTTGVEASGTVADTYALDGTIHQITPSGSILDVYYEFDVGVNGISTSALWNGYVQGNNDSVGVYGWNWVSSSYQQIGSIAGSSGTTIEEHLFTITRDMTGTGANAGLARIRFESSGGDVAVNLSTDRILCEYTSVASESMILNSGVLTAATADTATLATSAVATAGYYLHSRLIIVGGTGSGQERSIVDYTSGRVCTVDRTWTTTPDTTSVYEIISAICHAATQGGSYTEDSVHISANGSTTVLVNVDGTNTRPIDDGSLANARTVADTKNLNSFLLNPGSAITLNANYDNWDFGGQGSTIDLNGQSISNSRFNQIAMSGTGTGAGRRVIRGCLLNNLTVPSTVGIECVILGTFTMTEASFYRFDRSSAASSSAIFDFGAAIADTELYLQAWYGAVEIQNLGQSGTDVLWVTGDAEVTINANCVGGTIHYNGDVSFINNGSGITFVQGSIGSILEDTETDIPAQITAAQDDLDIITGATGVNLLSATQASIDAIETDTGTTLPNLVESGTIKKNTAFNDFFFEMVLTSDHVTPAPGLTVTGQKVLDSGSYVNVTGLISEVGSGTYRFNPTAADTNGDLGAWKFSAGTADDTKWSFKTT